MIIHRKINFFSYVVSDKIMLFRKMDWVSLLVTNFKGNFLKKNSKQINKKCKQIFMGYS